MAKVKFYNGEKIPLEMHKVRVIQKLNLIDIDERAKAISEAGNNTFLLQNKDVFLDMLTDSGVNAMSDLQVAAMSQADDSYAGSATYTKLENKVKEIFGKRYFLPAHQGRACENIIAKTLVKPGDVIPMNYHFTTTKSHIVMNGGRVEEFITEEGLAVDSEMPFKGDINLKKLEEFLIGFGTKHIPFVRIEAGTNLIGGQPVSLDNLIKTYELCQKYDILLVYDASLLTDNLYFIKEREEKYKKYDLRELTKLIAKHTDIIYFSGRKLTFARGGGICTSNEKVYLKMREYIPLYEGFLTYGGMSVREMEAMVIGFDESMDYSMICQGPEFIAYMVEELQKKDVPVVTPAGGLGCHLNAMEFVKHIPQNEYPAGALTSAIYIASGIRGMERGTLSEDRKPDGSETLANMELVRLALPRRVFTLSQVKYAIDRIIWVYENRHLIGGLRFTEEPKIMRFFIGKLEPVSNWQEDLIKKFKKDFKDSL